MRNWNWTTLITLACLLPPGKAEDQPQWGEKFSRNMVSRERGLPSAFDPKTGRNIKWVSKLGTESHSTPVIANGRVYVGTNNGQPRDPAHQGDRGVLMCFDETDGNLLWQLVVPKREEDPYHDWPKTGMSSPATVEGDRVYIVSNRGEVMCLDAKGMANGNDGPYQDEAVHMTPASSPPMKTGPLDADILWIFDLTSGAGIWSHDGAHSSILIDGDFLYLNTATGVDNTHRKIRTPEAPSLVVLDKQGRLIARDNEGIALRIFHCTWSSPSLGMVNGGKIVFFAGGNGVVYGFEPVTKKPEAGKIASLKKVWEFDFDPKGPKEDVHRFTTNRREGPSNIYGMPVILKDRLFVAGGGDLWWGKAEAWIKCIDLSGTGNVTTSAEIWSHPLEKHVLSTPAVFEDLVFIADTGRTMHCLDSKTGKAHWTQEVRGETWASPMVADGKVYLGTRGRDFWVFKASKEKEVLCHIDMEEAISGTAVPANGTLFVATMSRLFAISQKP